MKIKLIAHSFIGSLFCLASSNAATVIITNANDGLTDTLYADADNNPLSTGIVSAGYFASTVTPADIDTIPELFAALGGFTTITSIAFGSFSDTLGGVFAGYADQFVAGPPSDATDIGSILGTNPLFGRAIYTIVTDASSLGAATATSGFALFQSGVLSGDDPNVVEISVNPPTSGAIIGDSDSLTGDLAGQGVGNFSTLKLSAVPEPSTLLLSAFGVLGLLRRKR